MIRTRFAPSPTGYMHIGNLRTALYEFLIAKSSGGKFILRIEDTDQERLVEGSVDVIYETLKLTGLRHDEGPDVGGAFGPYVQSERKSTYMDYAKQLIESGHAYYCFCTKERLAEIKEQNASENMVKYDRHCLSLSKEEIEKNLADGIPFIIRQNIPQTGSTTFHDVVYGDITIENNMIEDQVLIKSDGLPTYNFANVVDDHLMEITHVVRGSEYLTSTPKYNLLYNSFGWNIPTYVHLPPVMKNQTEKLSKRNGDASFGDLVEKGFLAEAILNYIALLGWSPSENREIFSLEELIENFHLEGLSKSPSIFDIKKLTWMNGEYIKNLPFEKFCELALPQLKTSIKRTGVDLAKLCSYIQSRLETLNDIPSLVDFIDTLPAYDTELYVHKKMKTTLEIALDSLKMVLPILESDTCLDEHALNDKLLLLAEEKGIKNGQLLWPLRTALSGKPTSPCGASELAILLGKEETLLRVQKGIGFLTK